MSFHSSKHLAHVIVAAVDSLGVFGNDIISVFSVLGILLYLRGYVVQSSRKLFDSACLLS